MDLTPDDFEWVTTEIMKIADLCCSGRVVSVLEGGYGRPTDTNHVANFNEIFQKDSGDVIEGSGPDSSSGHSNVLASASLDNGCNTNTNMNTKSGIDGHVASAGSGSGSRLFNRDLLAASAAAHVRRLVDPYGPRLVVAQHAASPSAPSSLSPCNARPPTSHPAPASHMPDFPSSSSAHHSPALLVPSSSPSSSSSCIVPTQPPHTQSPSSTDVLTDLPLDVPSAIAEEHHTSRDELTQSHTSKILDTDDLT